MASKDILFVSKDNGVTERKPAHKTGRLCVAYSNKYNQNTFKIYGVLSHRLFIPFKFNNFYEAIEVAEYLEKVYGKYLDIWQADPSMNIPLVTRYTIKNGNRIFVALNKLKGQDIISKEEFFLALNGEYNGTPLCSSDNNSKQSPTHRPKPRNKGFISGFISGFLG